MFFGLRQVAYRCGLGVLEMVALPEIPELRAPARAETRGGTRPPGFEGVEQRSVSPRDQPEHLPARGTARTPPPLTQAQVALGLSRIVALYYLSSNLYQTH